MPAKPASFPSSVKVGGDVPHSSRTMELAPDGTELLYGDEHKLFQLRRGEKALRLLETKSLRIASACPLGEGGAAVAYQYCDDGDHVDVRDASGAVTTYRAPKDAPLLGCVVSTEAKALVGWGRASPEAGPLQLWWWSLGEPKKAPVVQTLESGVVGSAVFVDGTLYITIGEKLFAATAASAGAASIDGDLSPYTLAGARTGGRLLAKSGKSFVGLAMKGAAGKTLYTLPPVLKHARLTADGSRIVGYGPSIERAPAAVQDAYPEWLKTNFVALFDGATGKRLGWGKIADNVDALAIVDDAFIVTQSVKRIAFHAWKLATES